MESQSQSKESSLEKLRRYGSCHADFETAKKDFDSTLRVISATKKAAKAKKNMAKAEVLALEEVLISTVHDLELVNELKVANPAWKLNKVYLRANKKRTSSAALRAMALTYNIPYEEIPAKKKA